MREDREICCDSLTLSVLSEEEVTNYGFTIIKLAEISLWALYLPAVAGIINKKSKIKRRIIMIKLFKKNSYRISAIMLAVLLITGMFFLTGEIKTKADTNRDTQTIADTNEEANTIADTFGEPSTEIIDGVDCTFVDDQDVIGKWVTVDLVKDIDDFVPNIKSWPEDLYLLSIKLLPNGLMPKIEADSSDEIIPCNTWTKGYIINHYERTAGKYTIKEIDGTNYMFWEWKNGDYIKSGAKPYYYVLKQVE